MRNTAANVFDEFGCFGVKMGIFIIVFIGYIFIWMVEFSDVSSSDAGMFLNEFREGFFKELFLILMRGNWFFEIRYGGSNFFLFFLFKGFVLLSNLFGLIEDFEVFLSGCFVHFYLLHFLLVLWVILQPFCQISDGFFRLACEQSHEAFSDDSADFVLLQVFEFLGVHFWNLILNKTTII